MVRGRLRSTHSLVTNNKIILFQNMTEQWVVITPLVSEYVHVSVSPRKNGNYIYLFSLSERLSFLFLRGYKTYKINVNFLSKLNCRYIIRCKSHKGPQSCCIMILYHSWLISCSLIVISFPFLNLYRSCICQRGFIWIHFF